MSGISISPDFPFRRIKIAKQVVDPNATKALIDVVPESFHPVCHGCGQKAAHVRSWTQRSVRDLNLSALRPGCGAITANGCALAANAAAPSSSGSFTRICV